MEKNNFDNLGAKKETAAGGKPSVTKKIGDAIENVGHKLQDKGFKKAGDAIESLGDKVEHAGDKVKKTA